MTQYGRIHLIHPPLINPATYCIQTACNGIYLLL